MFRTIANKLVLGSTLVVVALVGMMDTADAQSRRVRWDPDFGAPFDAPGSVLGWRGQAIVKYGSCNGPGTVDNDPGSCNGALSFMSASVELYNAATPGTTLQTLDFSGRGMISALTFDGSHELTHVYSTPFTPVQGQIAETMYGGDQAWFSLYFAGEYAQLYWFQDNPAGDTSSSFYVGCYKPGDNSWAGNQCGISSNLNGQGAWLKITPVPEPQTYALMLAGLGWLAFMARRRARG